MEKTAARKSLAGKIYFSNFYHYHNIYFFETDSIGFSQDGQYLWSTPVDTALHHHSKDSVIYDDKVPFTYSFKDSTLNIVYNTKEGRTFHCRGYFVSDYEYTYGREILRLTNK